MSMSKSDIKYSLHYIYPRLGYLKRSWLFSLWLFSSTITAYFLIYTSYLTWPTQNTKISISFLNWIFAAHVKSNNKWNLWALIKLKVNYLIPILDGKVHLITTHNMVQDHTVENDWLYSALLKELMSRICYPAFWKLKGVFASTKSSRNNGPVLLFETIFALKLFPVVCCYG